MKNSIQVENAAPCIQRSNGLAGLAWNRLASTVRLKPHTTSPAITSDMHEIEVAAQEAFELRRRAGLFFKTSSEPHISNGHELSPRMPVHPLASDDKKMRQRRRISCQRHSNEKTLWEPGGGSCNTLAATCFGNATAKVGDPATQLRVSQAGCPIPPSFGGVGVFICCITNRQEIPTRANPARVGHPVHRVGSQFIVSPSNLYGRLTTQALVFTVTDSASD